MNSQLAQMTPGQRIQRRIWESGPLVIMIVLMLLVSGLVAGSQHSLITRLKASTPKITRAASVVLILVGAFHLYAAANVRFFVRLLFP